MKKNVMLKIASVLMVAVLLTTCAISSTFAKYVTNTDGGTTEAVVAKWGVTLKSEAPALFSKEYASGAKTYVKTTGEKLVIAPGTKNDANNSFKFSVAGTPEVAWKLTATFTVNLNGWALENDVFYCPVIFYVNGVAVQKGADQAAYATAIENAIAKELFGADGTRVGDTDNFVVEYAPGKGFELDENDQAPSVNVTWAWPFETEGNDDNDTYIADKTSSSISITYDLVAEQIGVEAGSTPKN